MANGVITSPDIEILLRGICQLIGAVRAGNPREFPPLEHIWYDLPKGPTVRVATAGNVVAGAFIETVWPAVPDNWMGVVRHIATFSDAPTLFRIQAMIDGVPIDPYDGIFGAIGDLATPFNVVIDIPTGRVFSLRMTNTDGVAHSAALRTVGWHYRKPVG